MGTILYVLIGAVSLVLLIIIVVIVWSLIYDKYFVPESEKILERELADLIRSDPFGYIEKARKDLKEIEYSRNHPNYSEDDIQYYQGWTTAASRAVSTLDFELPMAAKLATTILSKRPELVAMILSDITDSRKKDIFYRTKEYLNTTIEDNETFRLAKNILKLRHKKI
jgi:hypothetical protein